MGRYPIAKKKKKNTRLISNTQWFFKSAKNIHMNLGHTHVADSYLVLIVHGLASLKEIMLLNRKWLRRPSLVARKQRLGKPCSAAQTAASVIAQLKNLKSRILAIFISITVQAHPNTFSTGWVNGTNMASGGRGVGWWWWLWKSLVKWSAVRARPRIQETLPNRARLSLCWSQSSAGHCVCVLLSALYLSYCNFLLVDGWKSSKWKVG